MRIDENTNEYIYNIYEHGECHHSFRKLEINNSYSRTQAREIISQFINKYCTIKDNRHPVLELPPQLTRQLVELLQQDSKGEKVKLYPDPPSLF
jgi:hypothetical protein